MIGKIGKGKGFAGLAKYILEKEEAELLCTNLAGETSQDFYKQLSATRQLNPRVQSPVSHISISFAPGEKPPAEQLEQIVEGTLQGMGFEKNLYFAATHNDRNHFHLHVAASRINADGKCVSDWWDKRRLEKVLRGLEAQFDLTPVPCSWEVNRAAPTTGQKRRMMREEKEYLEGKRDTPAQRPVIDKIQDVMQDAIAQSGDFTRYVQALEARGVKVGAKVTREGVVDGLRYEMEGVRFPASQLGRAQKPTLLGLQRQGVRFDLEKDAPTLAKIAYSNKQKDNRSPQAIEKLIKANPVNRALVIPPAHQLIKQPDFATHGKPNESLLDIASLLPSWEDIESLLTASEPPLATAIEVRRELWEQQMLSDAIEQLAQANTSPNPDFEIAAFGGGYCAIRHHPTQRLIVADASSEKLAIRYAAQKGKPASLCNFTELEKQKFFHQRTNSSQSTKLSHQQLER